MKEKTLPALDQCEPQIIRAFEKIGWIIVKKPYPVIIAQKGIRTLFAYLLLKLGNKFLIVVEVKCFPDSRSIIDELYHTIGQYIMYRNALKLAQQEMPLYLAIPAPPYIRYYF